MTTTAAPEVKTMPYHQTSLVKPPAVSIIKAVDTRSPDDISAKPGGTFIVRVVLLDNQEAEFQIPKSALGFDLLHRVCSYLETADEEFFGFYNTAQIEAYTKWIKLEKSVKKQINASKDILRLGIKYYPTPFTVIKTDITKFLLCLQLKKDLVFKSLPATRSDLVMLGALSVKIEMGNFDSSVHVDNYVSKMILSPPIMRTPSLDMEIMEKHRSLTREMSTEDAINQYIDYARKIPFYGAAVFSIRDSELNVVKMSVSYSGLDFYKNEKKIRGFRWSQILEISRCKTIFAIIVRANSTELEHERLAYKCPGEKVTKQIWKFCTDCHQFYRGTPHLETELDGKTKLVRKFSFRQTGKINKDLTKPAVEESPILTVPVEESKEVIYAAVIPRKLRKKNSAAGPKVPTKDYGVHVESSPFHVYERNTKTADTKTNHPNSETLTQKDFNEIDEDSDGSIYSSIPHRSP